MFEREITSGNHRSYHVCVNNFGSNFKSKSKFHPIDEALSKIDEDFTDYECNITCFHNCNFFRPFGTIGCVIFFRIFTISSLFG